MDSPLGNPVTTLFRTPLLSKTTEFGKVWIGVSYHLTFRLAIRSLISPCCLCQALENVLLLFPCRGTLSSDVCRHYSILYLFDCMHTSRLKIPRSQSPLSGCRYLRIYADRLSWFNQNAELAELQNHSWLFFLFHLQMPILCMTTCLTNWAKCYRRPLLSLWFIYHDGILWRSFLGRTLLYIIHLSWLHC